MNPLKAKLAMGIIDIIRNATRPQQRKVPRWLVKRINDMHDSTYAQTRPHYREAMLDVMDAINEGGVEDGNR